MIAKKIFLFIFSICFIISACDSGKKELQNFKYIEFELTKDKIQIKNVKLPGVEVIIYKDETEIYNCKSDSKGKFRKIKPVLDKNKYKMLISYIGENNERFNLEEKIDFDGKKANFKIFKPIIIKGKITFDDTDILKNEIFNISIEEKDSYKIIEKTISDENYQYKFMIKKLAENKTYVIRASTKQKDYTGKVEFKLNTQEIEYNNIDINIKRKDIDLW